MAGLLTYSRIERLPEKSVAKVLFKTFNWSLQQRVLFRNLTGFPFIDSMMIVSIPKSFAKVQKK
jgi:hypothetical protein